MRLKNTRQCVDEFYAKNGPCCAGCDWWRYYNANVGECIKSAPVSASERVAMIGITGLSFNIGAGHAFTQRDHYCGDFKDEVRE